MAFSDFDLRTAQERFNLATDESRNLFSSIESLEVPERLSAVLNDWAPAALAMNTEKARSEMIIAPILMHAVQLVTGPVALFSGVTFDVDKSLGLNGVCDFLLTRANERYYIKRPVVAIIEAKKEDVPAGFGQCVAAMVGARLFNQHDKTEAASIYGGVTTGNTWRFAALEGNTVFIDRAEYHLREVGRILGILVHCVSESRPS